MKLLDHSHQDKTKKILTPSTIFFPLMFHLSKVMHPFYGIEYLVRPILVCWCLLTVDSILLKENYWYQLQVLARLAPFERGLYEDYVANFWCTTSVLVKWKKLFTTQSLRIFSLAATILTCLPSMVQQLLAPSRKGFLYGLLNSSFSFYLFSFQVHEKSILLPLLPLSLLALEEPHSFLWLMHFAMFSMFPLLHRDKLVLGYIAVYALFVLLYFAPGGPCGRCNGNKILDHSQKAEKGTKFISSIAFHPLVMGSLCFCSLILHVIYLTMHPPKKYPFLFEAVIMLLCFSQFVLFTFYFNSKQWMLSKHLTSKDKQKKHI